MCVSQLAGEICEINYGHFSNSNPNRDDLLDQRILDLKKILNHFLSLTLTFALLRDCP
jgi:hypothetical protein